jgi:hypothetical protein
MIYVLLAIIVIVIAVLLLRLRLRLRLDKDHRLLFMGLGRSGPELDFARGQGVLKLFGFRVKTFPIEKFEGTKVAKNISSKAQRARRHTLRRSSTLEEGKTLIRDILKASWRYTVDMFKASIIEQFDGRIEAGFESPDTTGLAFGYYQAFIGAVPAVAGRFIYVPVWTGRSFTGAFRFSIALPLYRLIYHTIRYWFRLPIRKMMKLSIGKKKGEQDVE